MPDAFKNKNNDEEKNIQYKKTNNKTNSAIGTLILFKTF